MPLTKVVLIDSELHPYLGALLVGALYKVGDTIRVPKKGDIVKLIEKNFEKSLANEGVKISNNYIILA